MRRFYSLYILLCFVLLCSAPSSLISQPYDYLEFWKATRYGLGSMPNVTQSCIKDLTIDAQGNVYVVGYGIAAETTPGSYQPTRIGGCNVFVAKFNSTLTTLVWATYLGGNADQTANSIALTSSGEVIICGVTTSTNFPVSDASDQQYLDGSAISFVAKFNSSGSRLMYCRAYARAYTISPFYSDDETTLSNGLRAIGSVAVNSSDEAIIYSTTTRNYSVTSNAFQLTFSGATDLCLSKFSQSGALLYSTYIGGSSTDESRCIAYANGKIYLSGRSSSANFPLTRNRIPDAADCIMMVWNDGTTPTPVGTYVLGGSGTDDCNGISYNVNTNKVMLVGMTSNVDFPSTATLQRGELSGGFVASLKPDLSGIDYATILGMNVKPLVVRSRINGDVVIGAGMLTVAAAIPTTPTALRLSPSSYDMVILSLGSDGTSQRYGSYFGGAGTESASTLAVQDINACTYRLLTSAMFSTSKDDFPMSSGAFRTNTCDCFSPGICILRSVHPDTFKITPKPGCGEFLFEGTTSPFSSCPLVSVIWNFDDSTTKVVGGTSISHQFLKNGSYAVKMSVVYFGTDTVVFEKAVSVSSYPTTTSALHSYYRCSKDSGVAFSATGAFRYEWHPGATLSDSTIPSPRARPPVNTKYYVRGYNAAGCWTEDSVQVYVVTAKAVVSNDTIICAGSTVPLKASGGGSFAWYPPTGLNTTKTATVVASPSQTTSYSVIVMDGNCLDTAKVTVSVSHKPAMTLTPSPIVCAGGTVQLSATLTSTVAIDTVGMHYSWTPAATLVGDKTRTPIAAPTSTTKYTCTATNAYGCSTTQTVDVRVLTALDLQLSPDTLTCLGSTLMLRASGGASYSWSPRAGLDDSTKANPLCTPTKKTTYRVVTWSGNYATATCRDTSDLTVDVYSLPPVTAHGDTTVCPHTAITLNVTPFDSMMTYRWTDENGNEVATTPRWDLSADSTHYYIVTATNIQGCSTSDTVRVAVNKELGVRAVGSGTYLNGTTVRLGVTNSQSSIQYEWRDSSGTIISASDTVQFIATTSARYFLHATRGGCESWDSVAIVVTNVVPVRLCADTAICRGRQVQLYVVNPQSQSVYEWKDLQGRLLGTGSTLSFVPDSSLLTEVTSLQNGISTYDTVAIRVFEIPVIVTRDTSVCAGHPAELTFISSDSSLQIQWFDGSNSLIATTAQYVVHPNQDSRFSIVVNDAHGCGAQASLLVSVTPQPLVTIRVGSLDSARPWQQLDIPVYAQSVPDVSISSLNFILRVGKSLIHISSAASDNIDHLLPYSNTVSLSSTPIEIMRVHGMALATSFNEESIRITDIVANVDTSCTHFTTQPGILRLLPICGNSLYSMQLMTEQFLLSPNPSNGRCTISSAYPIDELQVIDLLGLRHQFVLSTNELHLDDLCDGQYIVHARMGGLWVSRSVLILR